jgi:hypothetical protein
MNNSKVKNLVLFAIATFSLAMNTPSFAADFAVCENLAKTLSVGLSKTDDESLTAYIADENGRDSVIENLQMKKTESTITITGALGFKMTINTLRSIGTKRYRHMLLKTYLATVTDQGEGFDQLELACYFPRKGYSDGKRR